MPVTPTYPGVYIEEIPSGVRTIAGVATSITAFVGWASQGPDDRAILIASWSDYERRFGPLDARSDLSYGVYHFFNNGGQQALIVRLTDSSASYAKVSIGDLTLQATGKGEWAHHYTVTTKQRQDKSTHFSLMIKYVPDLSKPTEGPTLEAFDNVTLDANDPRFVTTVLADGSSLVTAEVPAGTTGAPPDTQDAPLAGGADGAVLNPGDDAFWAAAYNDPPRGVWRLDRVDLFNLLCVPGMTDSANQATLAKFCRDHRAFLIADCPHEATHENVFNSLSQLTGDDMINAAVYFPWLKASDPRQEGRIREFPPCGAVAGKFADTDVRRGVWKAPAGIDASLVGVRGVTQLLTDKENGNLNVRAVNCIRTFPVYGTVVWGARTLRGANEIGSEWKYIPIRRTALFIEESLYRGLKWVVFEPNDEPLWAQIRLNVGAFMHNLFRQGAFQGKTPREAYFVKCDGETTTQTDRNLGIVNIVVGFAPLKPAEFVIVKIQQMAGQIEV